MPNDVLRAESLFISANPRFLWSTCGDHVRQVAPNRFEEDEVVLCPVCRKPERATTEKQAKRIRSADRRCDFCKIGDHHLCARVGCYNCTDEAHARNSAPALAKESA